MMCPLRASAAAQATRNSGQVNRSTNMKSLSNASVSGPFRVLQHLWLILLVLSAIKTKAQTPDFAWAKAVTGSGSEIGTSIKADNSGNIYVVGTFNSPVIRVDGISLTNSAGPGSIDMFVVKYSSEGKTVWAKAIGGQGDDRGSIILDRLGNYYLSGTFTGPTLTLGEITLTNSTVGPLRSANLFVAKFSATDALVWAQRFGSNNPFGSDNDGVFGAVRAVDDAGNLYVAGQFFSDSITFGSTTLTNSDANVPGVRNPDLFFAKLDPQGKTVWARSAGGSGFETGSSLLLDKSGNIYASGSFRGETVSFGSTTLTNASAGSPEFRLPSDLFFVKFNPRGDVIWAKRIGDTGDESGGGLAIDSAENIYQSGSFSSEMIRFGSIRVTNSDSDLILPTSDFFIAKYDRDGNAIWVRSAQGDGNDSAGGLAVDNTGNIYAVGNFFGSSINLGAFRLNNGGIVPSPLPTPDIFLVKLNAAGDIIWAKGAGGSDVDTGIGPAVDGQGNVFFTGSFLSRNITFGNITITNSAAPAFTSDAFVVKIGAQGSIGPSIPVSLAIRRTAPVAYPVITLRGGAGQRYAIQSSIDLTTWSPLLTLVATNGVAELSDLSGTNTAIRFYRAVSLP